MFAYSISKGLDSVTQLADPTLWQFEMIFAALFLAVILLRFKLTRSSPTSLTRYSRAANHDPLQRIFLNQNCKVILLHPIAAEYPFGASVVFALRCGTVHLARHSRYIH